MAKSLSLQLSSSLLVHIQHEALSTSSPIFQAASFSLLSSKLRADSDHRVDLGGLSLHPTSTGSIHACQPLFLPSWIRDSRPSSHGAHHSPYGTVSSVRVTLRSLALKLTTGWCLIVEQWGPPLGTAASFPHRPSFSQSWQLAGSQILLLSLLERHDSLLDVISSVF